MSRRFEERWQFPHVIGAIDGKHVRIHKPNFSGSLYYNYKHYFSIVLMAIVDADYNFLYVDIGGKGGVSDGGIFRNSKIQGKFERKELNIPKPSVLRVPYSVLVPYMMLGDKAFALTDYCMRPFGGRSTVGSVQSLFNQRLSRARIPAEIAFGILSSRCRVLHTSINLQPEKASKVVMAAVYLHNFIRKRNKARYGTFEEPSYPANVTSSTNNLDGLQSIPIRPSTRLANIRFHLAHHFKMGN